MRVSNPKLLIVKFEDLKNRPEEVYMKISKKFFIKNYIMSNIIGIKNFDPIKNKVGLVPNSTNISSWRNLFSKDDLDFFYSEIPSNKFLCEE
jgi:hypothetical protein